MDVDKTDGIFMYHNIGKSRPVHAAFFKDHIAGVHNRKSRKYSNAYLRFVPMPCVGGEVIVILTSFR